MKGSVESSPPTVGWRRPPGIDPRASHQEIAGAFARGARRGGLAAAGLVLVAVALIDGADRRPAPPNAVLVVKGAPPASFKPGPTLRLGTYNIHGGRGVGGGRNLELTARTLRGLDLVGLQEVHGRSLIEPRDQSERLGELMGAASLFSPTESRWWRDNIGNGVVSRLPLNQWQRVPLEGTQDGRYRNALLIESTLTAPERGDVSVRVVIVHVDNQRDHDAQLAKVIALFRSLGEPAVLMGDLNTRADDPQLARLLDDPRVTAAIDDRRPDGKPTRGVDWIIARGLCCVASETRDFGASDHPAVVAELALPDPSGAVRFRETRRPQTKF